MTKKFVDGEKRAFMSGNETVTVAAIMAGAEIMFGYPITPTTEIPHYWTLYAPEYGLEFLQTEDEMAAGFATVGAVLMGKKAFTATAGPGNILMQDPMSMAEMYRLPTVVVIQQRGGPSTGTVIYSQQEVTLTTFGGNGEGMRIVYAPSGLQDLYDYTIKAFNVAWKYRFPTFVMGDGYVAKMRGSLTIYDPVSRGIDMVPAEPYLLKEGVAGIDRSPIQMRNCYNLEEELYDVVMSTMEAYNAVVPEIVEHKASHLEGAEIVVFAHGVVARAAEQAVSQLREAGYPAGFFRPITLRPFPDEAARQAVSQASRILVVESAYGQFARLLKESLYGSTIPMSYFFRPGLGFAPEEIVERVKEELKSKVKL